QVVFDPLVLRTARRPVVPVVVLIGRCRAVVAVGPCGCEHIETRVPRIKGVPRAGVAGRAGAVEATVGLLLICAGGQADGTVLRPIDEIRKVGFRSGETVVSDGREERKRGTHLRPVVRAEYGADIRTRLIEIAVVRLT